MAKPRPADVCFLSSPRTLSNLLSKLLSEQRGWQESSYFLHDAFEYAQGQLNTRHVESSAPALNEYLGLLRAGYRGMLAARENAHEKGRAFFLKSHITEISNPSLFWSGFRPGACSSEYTAELSASLSSPTRTNPTMLSDAMLLSFVPVFLIRHPALVVESYYRVKGFPPAAGFCHSNVPYSTGMRLTRALFEWYEAAAAASSPDADADAEPGRVGRRPLLVDADDVLEGDTVQRLATAIGMDAAQILQEWEAKPTEGMNPDKRRFVGDLWESTCIDRSKSAKGLVLAAKFESWDELYGVEAGKTLADLTNSHMEDYIWLKSRKF